jgi:hypothetical protein
MTEMMAVAETLAGHASAGPDLPLRRLRKG